MDNNTVYDSIIRNLFAQLAELYDDPDSTIETELSLDSVYGNYLLLEIGWDGNNRIRRTIAYVRLRQGKVSVEIDWTEHGIAPSLIEMGIPNSVIALGFNPPHLQPMREFAFA